MLIEPKTRIMAKLHRCSVLRLHGVDSPPPGGGNPRLSKTRQSGRSRSGRSTSHGPDDLGADAHDVDVVVLDRLVRGVHVVADRRADPFILFAAIKAPTPVPHTMRPRSTSPEVTLAATLRATSGKSTGLSSSGPTSTTSWPSARMCLDHGAFQRRARMVRSYDEAHDLILLFELGRRGSVPLCIAPQRGSSAAHGFPAAPKP